MNTLIVNANTGSVDFIAPPDREAPTDSDLDNDYQVTIEARDSDGASVFQSLTVTVTDQNDSSPVITPGQTLLVNENSGNGTAVGTLAATDVDTVGSLQGWSITGGSGQAYFAISPTTGRLTVFDSGGLNYESTTNFTLTVTVNDGTNTSAPEFVTINLLDINEAPLGANSMVTATEDTDYVFTPSDFTFADPDAGDSMSGVRIETMPTNGTLVLNGAVLNAGSGLPAFVSSVDLTSGALIYRPLANNFGSNAASFGVTVIDNAGLASAANVQSVSLVPVNDAPTVNGSQAAVVAAGQSVTIEPSTLQAVDAEDAASQLVFTLDDAPGAGILSLGGTTLTVGSSFNQADIDSGRIAYASLSTSDIADSVTITVRDSAGASNSGISVTITSISASAIAPPAGSNPSFSGAPDSSNESNTQADDATDSSDDEESFANAVQVVSPGPVYVGGAKSNGGDGSGTLSGESASLAANSLSADSGSRSSRQFLFQGTDGGRGAGLDNAEDLFGLSGGDDEYRSVDYRRVPYQFSNSDLQSLRDHMSDALSEAMQFDQQVVASSIAVSSSLSIGYVIWLLRGGALLSSVLASIPAWRSIDPLPVLSSLPTSANDSDDQSLEERLEKVDHHEEGVSSVG